MYPPPWQKGLLRWVIVPPSPLAILGAFYSPMATAHAYVVHNSLDSHSSVWLSIILIPAALMQIQAEQTRDIFQNYSQPGNSEAASSNMEAHNSLFSLNDIYTAKINSMQILYLPVLLSLCAVTRDVLRGVNGLVPPDWRSDIPYLGSSGN